MTEMLVLDGWKEGWAGSVYTKSFGKERGRRDEIIAMRNSWMLITRFVDCDVQSFSREGTEEMGSRLL